MTKTAKILLLLTLVLAFVLRVWKLGDNPPSLDWDEASLGYNAYSILKTGRDEYGNFLPMSIRSFNDYKPPLYTYLALPAVAVFGLNELSVRLPSAVFGFLAVISCFYLVRLMNPQNIKLALLTAFFLSISPWHIQFSRIAFEANLALSLYILAITLFLKSLKSGIFYPFSALVFALSIYSYHSPRLIIPIVVLGLVLLYFKRVTGKLPWFLTFVVLLFVTAFPVIKEINRSTGARFSSVSVVNPDEKLGASIAAMEFDRLRGEPFGKILHNRRLVFGREILAGYLDHFNFDFLFLTGDPPGRHHAAGMGMLYVTDLPLILLGIVFLALNFKKKAFRLILLLFFAAPLASSLTTGTPHAVRAIFYLPVYQIIAALGLIRVSKKSYFKYVFCLLLIINFLYYLHQYYVHTPVEYASSWQYGYKEAVYESEKHYGSVDKIIVTYRYDQPYIYFLFYNRTDPAWYQSLWRGYAIKRAERQYDKYEFRNINWEQDSQMKNALLIGTPEEIPDNAPGITREIFFPDGTIAFRIVKRI
ncbi:hypothetical protein A2777_05665 [Candidatus Gottesmanbacteria bacterium RIFCSPHIGHO2_01_FULL_40_15]|uniref:Glycosyltransferase RgtA/B/C/D-like domain-containing protein n=1 Tax=Candidatus Gottesmanbacteria bacterium RIFCSPHIGHO2_01_FULL_40_15 TaxID=1798376 RepID=A0A1F5Z1W2_9BACT|nr:MAG: hypothetical protein A2777_05665 [Candidatus Gottesmanbacteria bacterium RIFCSPHIGHO2_01_FULL_40_15]